MTISRFARFALRFAILTVFLSLAALGASADSGTTYTYASQDYTNWNTFVPCPSSVICQTTGSMTFATALPDNMTLQVVTLEAWSFTDGITVLDNTNSSLGAGGFATELATNASGQITQWIYYFSQGDGATQLFQICGDSAGIGCGAAAESCACDYYDVAYFGISPHFEEYAYTNAGAGTWTGGGGDNGNGNGNGTNPMPEPGAFSLLASGILILFAAAHRKLLRLRDCN
jgi:hypothetical protein